MATAPRKKPTAKKTPPKRPSAAELKRRAAQKAEAEGQPVPAKICMVIGEGKDQKIEPINGVMLLFDERTADLTILPVGIHPLMTGDILDSALKMHRGRKTTA